MRRLDRVFEAVDGLCRKVPTSYSRCLAGKEKTLWPVTKNSTDHRRRIARRRPEP